MSAEQAMPDFTGKMPSMDELLKLVDTLEMTDEEREDLRKSLHENAAAGLKVAAKSGIGWEIIVLLVLLSLAMSGLIFFGYKLFKSLRDREVKKEEKRRQKQMRKKK